MSAPLEVVILAAGQGKRMYSDTPKVLHQLAGRPLLAHVLESVHALKPIAVHVVYGHGGERVREAFAPAGRPFRISSGVASRMSRTVTSKVMV